LRLEFLSLCFYLCDT